MEDQPSRQTKIARETGALIHRRETNRQIYLPFLFGMTILLIAFLIVALPSAPEWLDRAQAIADFLYTLLCIIPILICLLPVYVMILLGVYGMTKLHDGVESPLRKLENLTASLAGRIETATEYVTNQTTSFNNVVEPIDTALRIFDTPPPSNREETTSDEPTESTGNVES